MGTQVFDDYISGETAGSRTCERCWQRTLCIEIKGVNLPKGVTLASTILAKRGTVVPHDGAPPTAECIRFIGIGCGDYARFHRQLVHITGSMERSRG